uniref:Protein S100-A11 n=2 Tax=Ailuropoda melanoleuca TaxID=9646 RepID=A0A7N5P2X0_AILME
MPGSNQYTRCPAVRYLSLTSTPQFSKLSQSHHSLDSYSSLRNSLKCNVTAFNRYGNGALRREGICHKCCNKVTSPLLEPGVSANRTQAKMSSPTETERCIESLIAVFQKFAGKEGNNCTLSKTEFLTFMNTELAAFTKNQKDPGVLDRMMKKLDLNSDGQLDFQEFLNLIGGMAIACHDSFTKSTHFQK